MRSLKRIYKGRPWLIPAVLFAVLLICCGLWLGTGYDASGQAERCLQSTDAVQVREIPQGILLDGPGTEDALVFYPGGKVEYTAYLPLLRRLSEDGTDCFLVRMPFDLAVFGKDRAGDITEQYEYRRWLLGGHSLGGAMAADYAADHPADGLILLAAYPTKKLKVPTLQIYGSRDRVLNMERLEESRADLPEDAELSVLPGGNHAQFGDYGVQKGDGAATISRQEQQALTVELIEDWLARH